MVKFKCAQRNTKNVKALELRAFTPPGNSLGAASSRNNYRITPWLMPRGRAVISGTSPLLGRYPTRNLPLPILPHRNVHVVLSVERPF